MRCFVTGATGFIGGRLATRLLREGHEAVALVRDPERAGHLADLGADLVEGDITEPATLREPMDGADVLFHLAGWYKVGVDAPGTAEAVNVEGTRNVLRTMEEVGVPRGVYTSTLAVNSDTRGRLVDETYTFEGRHLSLYDRTKAEAHEVAEGFIERGLPLTIAMPGVVYGPGDTSQMGASLRDYLRGELPAVPRRTAYCWAHVDDVVEGHLLALRKGEPGESYILAGPPHTHVEALELAEELTGVPAPRAVPPWVLRTASVLLRPLAAMVDVPPTYHPEALRVVAGVTYLGDNGKARRELGYDPRPLREGLEETLRYEMGALQGDR